MPLSRLFIVQIVLFGFVLCAPGTLAETGATSLAEAIGGGDTDLQFRYRLETVDQDGLSENALASSLKTRVTFRTAPYRDLDFLLEIDDVTYVGDDDFNNTRNGKAAYPVVVDPKGTDINQAVLRIKADSLAVSAGRQRINRDNQRFVGGVGWRQNEQTYDGLDVNWSAGDAALSYDYLARVSRIFGPEPGTPSARLDSDSHLVNFSYDFGGPGKLSAYGYLLDLDTASASTRTIGVRWAGALGNGEWKYPLAIEYADQSDYANSPLDYSASYRLVEFGVENDRFAVTLGNEVLGGETDGVFVTPLATLHKFQGWADKFLATPAGGIDDRYVSANASVAGFGITAAYHEFEADLGGADYGSEIDLSIAKGLGDHFSVLLKVADYDGDSFATDTTKVWLMLSAIF